MATKTTDKTDYSHSAKRKKVIIRFKEPKDYLFLYNISEKLADYVTQNIFLGNTLDFMYRKDRYIVNPSYVQYVKSEDYKEPEGD